MPSHAQSSRPSSHHTRPDALPVSKPSDRTNMQRAELRPTRSFTLPLHIRYLIFVAVSVLVLLTLTTTSMERPFWDLPLCVNSQGDPFTNTTSSELASNVIGHRPFQVLVLSPKQGFVVGIVSPAYRKIPMFLYLDRTDKFLLLHENKTFSKSFTGSRSHAEILFAWFDIGIEQWTEWKHQPPPTLVVKDPLQLGEEYPVPLLVDPALQQATKHGLSATTIVRKILRHYNGKTVAPGDMFHPEYKPKWDDEETVRRLKFWMQHHENIGITHFYIVDNEVDTSKPNLKEIEQMESVTYVRLPHIHFDSFRLDEAQDLKGLRYGFPGQVVMENAILRMAYTDWLLYTDLDELIVPALYNNSLALLIDHFKDKHCSYHLNDTFSCQSIDYPKQGIFQLKFSNALIDAHDKLTGVEFGSGKVAVRPDFTEAMLIHLGEGSNSSFSTACVPPKHGFMAHYHALKEFSADLLAGAKSHAKEMTMDYYCLQDDCKE